MGSDEVQDKLRLAIAMGAARHVGYEAGKAIYEMLRISYVTDPASYSHRITVRAGGAARSFSHAVGNDLLREGVTDLIEREIIDEMVPVVCLAWAADSNKQTTWRLRYGCNT